jgi:anti-anti-sigma factor
MEIQAKQVNDLTVLFLTGSINSITVLEITKDINELVSTGKVKLIFDLGAVPYMSSAGLRMFLGLVKETRARSGDVRLVAVRPDVQRILNMSGFANILKIFDNIETAMAGFS